MSPHHALMDPDVLAEIFSHLSLVTSPLDVEQRRPSYWGPIELTRDLELQYNDSSVTKRHTLASAALTCKAFSEHAVTHLWAAPRGGLYTLLSLCSTFTRKVITGYWVDPRGHERDFSMYQYYLAGDITDYEWETIVKCASRVREFAFHRLSDLISQIWVLDLSVIETIVHRSEGRLLFPQLRALMWQRSARDINGPTLDQFLPLLLTERLSTLMLMSYPSWPHQHMECSCQTHQPPRDGIPQDVVTIVTESPNIEHIRVYMCFESGKFAQLAQCPRLRTFVAHWVDTHALMVLGSLPRLRKLKTSLGPGPVSQDSTVLPPPMSPLARKTDGLFPVLQELHLDRSAAIYAKMMILSISSCILSSITVELREVDPSLVHPFFTALPAVAMSLRSLKVRLACGFLYHPSNLVVFEVAAAPLFELRNLEYLQFDMDERSISLTDGDLMRMARSWPHIVALYIAGDSTYAYMAAHSGVVEPPVIPVDRPSIHALVALARQCPHLVTCIIPTREVTDADLEKLEQDTAAAAPQPQLLQLALAGRRPFSVTRAKVIVHDRERLMSTLRRIFPMLDSSRVMAGGCDSIEVLQKEAAQRQLRLRHYATVTDSLNKLVEFHNRLFARIKELQ